MSSEDLPHLVREVPMATPHTDRFTYDEAPARFIDDVKQFSESHYAGLYSGRKTQLTWRPRWTYLTSSCEVIGRSQSAENDSACWNDLCRLIEPIVQI